VPFPFLIERSAFVLLSMPNKFTSLLNNDFYYHWELGRRHSAGIHRTYMGRIERGESNPPVQTVNKIAKALRRSLTDLFIS